MNRVLLRRGLSPILWAALLVAASHWAGLTSRVPSLGVWNGPLGWVLAATSIAIALASVRREAGPRADPGGHAPLALGGSGALFLLGALPLLLVGLRYASGLRVSGDEPHYLVMAQSLWREGDLDLRDNYARADWGEYTPGPVAPHYGSPRADGRPYPAHSVGLPVLLAPVYAAGGRLGCVALMAFCAAGAAALGHSLALRLGASPRAALLAWACALGPPLFFYGFHVYTEAPSALAVMGALLLIQAAPNVTGAACAALLAASLPWLHVKMIPCAAALGVIALLQLGGKGRVVFTAVAALAAAGYFAYYKAIFGVASPLAIYGGGLPGSERGSVPRALLGLLLDRSFGLLPHAPVFLLALRGWRWRDARSWPLAVVGLAILLPVLGWRMWWGGQSPPARFLVPLVPVLAVMIALRVGERPRGLTRWAWPLFALGLGAALFMAWDPGALLLVNRGDRPTRLWSTLSGATAVGDYLPSLVAWGAEDVRVAAVWVAAIVVLLVLDALAERQDAVDRWFRGLGLPLAIVVMIGLCVDGWARPWGLRRSGAPSEMSGGAGR